MCLSLAECQTPVQRYLLYSKNESENAVKEEAAMMGINTEERNAMDLEPSLKGETKVNFMCSLLSQDFGQ